MMNITEEVKVVIAENRYIKNDDNNLEYALEIYHELVEKKIIVPRGNQLMPNNIAYIQRSNF